MSMARSIEIQRVLISCYVAGCARAAAARFSCGVASAAEVLGLQPVSTRADMRVMAHSGREKRVVVIRLMVF